MPPVSKKNLFYIRVGEVLNEQAYAFTKGTIELIGRVLASGQGTVKDKSSAWFEVEVQVKYLECVRETLASRGIPVALIAEVFPCDRGEGKLQAQQLLLV